VPDRKPPRRPARSAPSAPPAGKRPLKTLERVISKAGLGSRTEARRWIGTGRVRVNGKLIQTPDHWVDLERDRVTLDGKPVLKSEQIYLLLYKPAGYLTTYKDPEGRPTVYDLLGDIPRFVAPVGRLDLDTSGLLVLTNDTDFAERVTNPEFKVPKTYLVKTASRLAAEDLARLRDGVELKDGPTKPAEVTHVRDSGDHTFFELTITEGRNRQVRRMVEAVGSKVLKLERIAIGPIRIGALAVGKHRPLTPAEQRALGCAT
jgi:23S rRNA pseudouridine2605 synthase